MYAKSTRPSAKHDDRIARPRRAQTCERSELRAKRAAREACNENVPAKRADFCKF